MSEMAGIVLCPETRSILNTVNCSGHRFEIRDSSGRREGGVEHAKQRQLKGSWSLLYGIWHGLSGDDVVKAGLYEK